MQTLDQPKPSLFLLKNHFGYSEFKPLQQEIISHVLAHKHAFVLLPTGGGKSLCYQLPALQLPGLTLVVSPLIALMKDQVDTLQANGIAAHCLHSLLPASEIEQIYTEVQKGDCKLLYLAPERLASPDFRAFLTTLPLSLLAIDEAHCISQWGHDFRPDYRNLAFLRQEFPNVPVIALTATATQAVQADILEQLKIPQAKLFLDSFNRANLTYHVRPKRQAFEQLLTLIEQYKNESVIIYCLSRKDTEALAEDLSLAGFKALPYHAGLNPSVRQAHQEQFMRDEYKTATPEQYHSYP